MVESCHKEEVSFCEGPLEGEGGVEGTLKIFDVARGYPFRALMFPGAFCHVELERARRADGFIARVVFSLTFLISTEMRLLKAPAAFFTV